jgi:hypothetical protein
MIKQPPHAQLHLPSLEPEAALVVVNVLERAIQAIWRAHGDRMAELLYARHSTSEQRPDSEFADIGDPNASPDTDF